jgi:hypothetical protein
METESFSNAPRRRRAFRGISGATRRTFPAAASLLAGLLLVGCQQLGLQPEGEKPKSTHVQEETPEKDHFTLLPDQIRWIDPPPAAGFLPEGVKLAFIEGGPPTIPVPFTIRLRFPPGSRLMPHTHPSIEKLTVISGTLHQGVGEAFDQAATETVPAGGFAYRAPGIPHFVWFDEETVLQFHGMGPFDIKYVNPADDPRNKG